VSRPRRAGRGSGQPTARRRDVDSDRIEGEKKQQEGKLQETWGEAKDKARDIKDDVEDALDRDDDDELVEDRG